MSAVSLIPGFQTPRRTGALALLALVALGPPHGAHGQGIDLTQGGPIQITARDGIEWRQADQMVIANGDAKAIRAGATVTAERLIAWYRSKSGAPAPAATGLGGATTTEGNEVYRMRAENNVHVYTQTDQAWGDQATYDLDQSVLVMTGRGLRLITPTDTLTARDTLEYWSEKHMAVARGDAVIVTHDGRRVSADTLVAYSIAGGVVPPVATKTPSPAPSGDGMAAMAGRLDHVEAFGNVIVRTATDIVTGDRAIYVPDTGIARLGGHVRITRGSNQINGSEAVVNMKTGVATLLAGDTGRVTGLVMPNERESAAAVNGPGSPVAKPPAATPKAGVKP